MRIVAILLMMTTIGAHGSFAQAPPQGEIWRAFAQQIDVGSRITVRFDAGRRVSATLIQANATELLLQPRTRIPVPVQRVAYDRIVSLERDDARGTGAGTAVALGVASGVAAFFGTLLIVIAAFD